MPIATLYNHAKIAEIIQKAIASESKYQPYTDRALCEIATANGEDCNPQTARYLRRKLGFKAASKRRQEVA